MVKAKKNKLIHLTKTQKKGITLKKELIQKVHQWIDEYDCIYLLQIPKGIKTVRIQKIREEWKPKGRFSFGKNKLLVVALGKKPEDEYQNNLHMLSEQIKGNSALLFTNESEQRVKKYLHELSNQEDEISIELLAAWKKDGSFKQCRARKITNSNQPMEA